MLDNPQHIANIDKSHLLETITHFPEQIQKSIEIVQASPIDPILKIDNILVTGMGASAISGDIVASLFRDKIDVPIFVNRQYTLPKWAKKDTLTFFLSYSGNTEETIHSFKIAHQKKCKIICISSGGKLEEFAQNRGVTHIKIPSGYQPRAATAFLLFPLILLLKKMGLLKNAIETEIEETIALTKELSNKYKSSIPESENFAKQTAQQIFGTIPQIYGWGIYAPIATRWRQQFNENSKIIAREDVVSECNHNDIVGWSANPEKSKDFSCFLFRDKENESLYYSTRLDFMKNLLVDTVAHVLEIQPHGKSKLAKITSLMYLGDFVSCYLAILRKIDPSPVDIITELKKRLAQI